MLTNFHLFFSCSQYYYKYIYYSITIGLFLVQLLCNIIDFV